VRRLILVTILFLVSVSGCSTTDPYPESFYSSASYLRVASDGNGGYWHEHDVDGITTSPGMSGATLVVPSVNTLGGYQLDAANEYLYFDIAVEDNYDGVADAELIVYFELGLDNVGGAVTDVVALSLHFWCKQEGDIATTYAEYIIPTVIGTASQYTLFAGHLECTPVPDSIMSFRLSLDTVNSDVDNVIINYVKLRYPTLYPALERD